MKNLSFLLLFSLVTIGVNAQPPAESILSGKVAKRGILYAKSITTDDLKKHLYVLAADSLEGRDTGSEGLQKAATYISSHFQSVGLQAQAQPQKEKNYFQPVELNKFTQQEAYVIYNGKTYPNLQQVLFRGAIEEAQKEVVFVGFGREADYEGKDVQSKVVLAMFDLKHDIFQVAKAKGAHAVLFLIPDTNFSVKNVLARFGKAFTQPLLSLPGDEPLPDVLLSEQLAAMMLGVEPSDFAKLKGADSTALLNTMKNAPPFSVTMKSKGKTEKIQTPNVLGYIEGGDKKEELIVISAHYDHVGIGTPIQGDSIFNGADDDASGTSAVMELAQAFALAKQQGKGARRSLLFLTVTGEEKGLWGSSYYVEHPLFALSNTVTNINLDMIGRIDSAHMGKGDYVYVVGADRLSSELHRVNEMVNSKYLKFTFDYKYNAKDDPERIYERSDHYNFAKKNIPIVFFTSGLHPDYHQPSDSADKIDYDALQKRAQMIFHLAWELANRENRVTLDSMSERKP